MLKNSFIHIQGISSNTEQKLWESGIICWDDFFEKKEKLTFLSENKKSSIINELVFSKQHLENRNLNYFNKKLPSNQLWRCVGYGKIAYVDIETTGLSKYTNEITVVGIYDGKNSQIFINGENLEQAWDYLRDYDIIVTFNGKQFDIPFIEHYFKNTIDAIHLDLRFMLKELGLRGGLKVIEKSVGIKRDDEVENIDGFEAVKLWNRYKKRGCQDSLNKLIQYNIEDIINLEKLLDIYLENKKQNIKELIEF